jgi:hypothetical protein
MAASAGATFILSARSGRAQRRKKRRKSFSNARKLNGARSRAAKLKGPF